jgi:hypothetical protein
MAALHLSAGSMSGMGSGASGMSFLVPLLVGITIVTFAVTLVISLSPSEDEIHEDARLRDRIATEFSASGPASPQPATRTTQPQSQPNVLQPQSQPSLFQPQGPQPQSQQQPPTPPSTPLPTRRPSSDALAGRNRIPRRPD